MFLQAAADAVQVSNPALTNQIDAVMHQLGLAGATVYVLQFLKKSPLFPWLNANSETATRIVSTAAALIAAIFVQVTVQGDTSAGWVIHVPAAHVLWDCFLRFVGQKLGLEAIYRNLVKSPPEVAIVPPEKFDAVGKPAEPKTLVVSERG